MQVVDRANLPPGFCFICRSDPPIARSVDTLVQFNPSFDVDGKAVGPVTPYNGRIYICEHCVDTMAKKLGYNTKYNVEKEQANTAETKRQLDALRLRVLEIAEQLDDAVPDQAMAPRNSNKRHDRTQR
jgi:hypothetical protein